MGCSLTLVCWLSAVLLSIGWMMGDCFPREGHACPTDHQRDLSVLKIVLGAAAFNVGGLLLLGYRHTGRPKE
jgi:hypothetical protein